MQKRVLNLIFMAPAVLVLSSFTFAQTAPRPAARANTPGPATGFDPHDLSGFWQKYMWDTVTMGNDVPPRTAYGQQKFNASKPGYGPRAVPPVNGNDPNRNCDPLGMPRMLFLEFGTRGMEMIQTPKKIVQLFEWGHLFREIWTDGRKLPEMRQPGLDPEPRWNGYSVGRWEGDTFIVDSLGFDDRTWLDHFGNPISDEARLEERYRRVDADTIELKLTLTDPKILTKPWVSTKTLKLNPKKEIGELLCVPSTEMEFNRVVRDPAGAGVK